MSSTPTNDEADRPSDRPLPAPIPADAATDVPAQRPAPVDLAVNLMYAGAVLSFVGIFTVFPIKDDIRSRIRETAAKKGTEINVDQAVNFALGFSVVISVIAIGVWIWMARANGAGKSWARIVATVLTAFDVLGLVSSIAQGTPPSISLAGSIITVVLAAVITFLLWRPASSRFFSARRA